MPYSQQGIFNENRSGLNPVHKPSTISPIRFKMSYIKKVPSNSTMNEFVDPRFEDEAIAALMEEALSETKADKFDVESYIENSEFEW